MLIAVLILALIMTSIGWHLSHDIFSPYVAVPGVWAIAILIYYFLPNTFYPVHNKFPYTLAIWLVGFFISSITCEFLTPSASIASVLRQPSQKVLYIYTAITCISIPIVCGIIIKQALLENPENIFRYMRIMNTGIDENIEMPNLGILIYFVALAFIMLFYTLIYFKSKTMIILITILNLIVATVTMAKTTFLSIMFSALYLCYVQGKIKIRHLVYGLLAFILLSFGVQSLRAVGEDLETNSFLALYLSSSIVAFDYYTIPFSSEHLGMHTFRILYAIGHTLGITEPPTETILEFVSIPDMTNTYTNMYPFYEDFGNIGVFVFSIVYGIFYGFLYKKSRTGGKIQLVLYAIFLTFVLMEFIGEFIFTNMSVTIQYIVFATLPFLFSKQNTSKYSTK